MSTLDEIGVRLGVDKSSAHHDFLVHYERALQGKDIKTIVEIGVWKGQSLRMWAEYFPQASIFGCDIDPKLLFSEGNIRGVECNQADQANLRGLMTCFRLNNTDPDLFIDDGSHMWSHQLNTYQVVWPLLKSGAVYIAEDLHTSIPPASGYNDCQQSPLEFFAHLKHFTVIYNGCTSITGIGIKGEQ